MASTVVLPFADYSSHLVPPRQELESRMETVDNDAVFVMPLELCRLTKLTLANEVRQTWELGSTKSAALAGLEASTFAWATPQG